MVNHLRRKGFKAGPNSLYLHYYWPRHPPPGPRPTSEDHCLPRTSVFYWSAKLKSISPDGLAPPTHVLVKLLPNGHAALAALMQPSHLPFETLIVAPASVAASEKRASPEDPVVEAGEPWHCSILPVIPPQIESKATSVSWKSILLQVMSLELTSEMVKARGRDERTR